MPTDPDAHRRWLASRQVQERNSAHMLGNSRFDKALGKVIKACVYGSGLYHWGRRNALAVRLTGIDVELPSLPSAFDGYRILHLTDLHLDALPQLVGQITRWLEGQEFDLCVMTGDYRESLAAPESAYMPQLQTLLASVSSRDGILATLGNHDSYTAVAALEKLGVHVLVNSAVHIHRDDQHIAFSGVDDPSFFMSQMTLDMIRANDHPCNVLLAHSPELADEAAKAGYRLYLAGHTHGGQIALPGGRPIITRLARRRDLAVGPWRVGDMHGFTSCGLGVGVPTVRFNTRGEATVVTLRSTSASAL